MTQITTTQVAERYEVSPRTIRRMIASGELTPATKLPARTGPYLFEEEEAERAFATRKAPAA